MKSRVRNILTVASVSFALAWPAAALSQAGEMPASPQAQPQESAQPVQNPQKARREAREMVPATVKLAKKLDAQNDLQGSEFNAKLTQAVQLKNGPELPKGTTLVGTVATDDIQMDGVSKLAVRFTEAKVTGGETVPIKATIVQEYPPVGFTRSGWPIPTEGPRRWDNTLLPNVWSPGILRVEQIGALKNVNMLSNVASRNSGVFMSTRTDDVKLMRGSRLQLALSARWNG